MLHISNNFDSITLPSINELLLYGKLPTTGSSSPPPPGFDVNDQYSSSIELPPLQNIDNSTPSPSLKPMYPNHHLHHPQPQLSAADKSTTVQYLVSSSAGSSLSSNEFDAAVDSPFQHLHHHHQQRTASANATTSSPYPMISKCKHLHGRSLSSDDTAAAIPFCEQPPWISRPLRIIHHTAAVDHPLLLLPSSSPSIAATGSPSATAAASTNPSGLMMLPATQKTATMLSSLLSSSSSPSTTLTTTTTTKAKKQQQRSTTSNNIRKYACTYCRKAFTRPSSLRTHIYSHTGQKPFACTFGDCDKHFSVLSNMRRHMRRHSVPYYYPTSTSSSSSSE